MNPRVNPKLHGRLSFLEGRLFLLLISKDEVGNTHLEAQHESNNNQRRWTETDADMRTSRDTYRHNEPVTYSA